MEIKVIGSGCAGCANLYERVKKIVEEKKVGVKVEYVKDISQLIELGVMSSPALVVNGKVAAFGSITDEEIESAISSGKKE